MFAEKKCDLQKLLTQNISLYAILHDQSLSDMLTNNIVSFEQLGPDHYVAPAWQKDTFLLLHLP